MNTLIIVDDEPLFLNFAQKCIAGYFPDINVLGCFLDGREALDFLTENPVDIILTDISMPNMDGLELAREIDENMPQCVTIIISSYSSFEYARNAIKYNVSNYLLKPLNINELKSCMEKALALSASRKAALKSSADLWNESTEVFFSDLLLGMYSSKEDFQTKFEELHFPFSLSESAGTLLMISADESAVSQYWHYDIDQLSLSLKNILSLTLESETIYFVRKSSFHFYYIVIGIHAMDDYIDSFIDNIRENLHIQCTIPLRRHFNNLSEFTAVRDSHSQAVSPKAQTFPGTGNDTLIAKAIKYMNTNYCRDLSREEVARYVFLSPSHFGLQFKKETGMSFTDYLANIRMQKAIELLNTTMKVQEIALKVGYQSKNRFFINFRQYTSYTPTEYRRNVLCMEDESDETQVQ